MAEAGMDITYQGIQAEAAMMPRTVGFEPDTGFVDLSDDIAAIEIMNVSEIHTQAAVLGAPKGFKAVYLEGFGKLVCKQAGVTRELENIYLCEEGFSENWRDEQVGVPRGNRIALQDERCLWRYGIVIGNFNMPVKTGGVEIPGYGRFDPYSLKPEEGDPARNIPGEKPGKYLYTLWDLMLICLASLPSASGKIYEINHFDEKIMDNIHIGLACGAGKKAREAMREILEPYGLFPAPPLPDGTLEFYYMFEGGGSFDPLEHEPLDIREGTTLNVKANAYAITSKKPVIREKNVADWIPVVAWDGSSERVQSHGASYFAQAGDYVSLEDACLSWGISVDDLRDAILIQARESGERDSIKAVVPKDKWQKKRISILQGQAFKWFQMTEEYIKGSADLPMLQHRLDHKDTNRKLPIRVYASVFGPVEDGDPKKGCWKNQFVVDASQRGVSFDYAQGVIKFKDVVGVAVPDPAKIENAEKKAQAAATAAARKTAKDRIAQILSEVISSSEQRALTAWSMGYVDDSGNVIISPRASVPRGDIGNTTEWGGVWKSSLSEKIQAFGLNLDTLALEGLTTQDVQVIYLLFQELANQFPDMAELIEQGQAYAKQLQEAREDADATFEKDTSVINLEICRLEDGVINVTYAYESRAYWGCYIGKIHEMKHFEFDWIAYEGVFGSNLPELRDRALEIIKKDQSGPKAVKNAEYTFDGPLDVPSCGRFPQIVIDGTGETIVTKVNENGYLVGIDDLPAPILSIRKTAQAVNVGGYGTGTPGTDSSGSTGARP